MGRSGSIIIGDKRKHKVAVVDAAVYRDYESPPPPPLLLFAISICTIHCHCSSCYIVVYNFLYMARLRREGPVRRANRIA